MQAQATAEEEVYKDDFDTDTEEEMEELLERR